MLRPAEAFFLDPARQLFTLPTPIIEKQHYFSTKSSTSQIVLIYSNEFVSFDSLLAKVTSYKGRGEGYWCMRASKKNMEYIIFFHLNHLIFLVYLFYFSTMFMYFSIS